MLLHVFCFCVNSVTFNFRPFHFLTISSLVILKQNCFGLLIKFMLESLTNAFNFSLRKLKRFLVTHFCVVLLYYGNKNLLCSLYCKIKTNGSHYGH